MDDLSAQEIKVLPGSQIRFVDHTTNQEYVVTLAEEFVVKSTYDKKINVEELVTNNQVD